MWNSRQRQSSCSHISLFGQSRTQKAIVELAPMRGFTERKCLSALQMKLRPALIARALTSKWSSCLDESASAFDRKRNVTKIIAKILEYHKSRCVLLCACLRLSCVIAWKRAKRFYRLYAPTMGAAEVKQSQPLRFRCGHTTKALRSTNCCILPKPINQSVVCINTKLCADMSNGSVHSSWQSQIDLQCLGSHCWCDVIYAYQMRSHENANAWR